MSSDGYIYVKGWERFQHPDVVRSTRMPWIRNYVDLLENEDYLDLGASERALLECIWKWSGLVGNGRVPAKVSTLRNRFRLRNCNLEPLIQAGFIEVLASKAQAPRKQQSSTEGEEGSKEPSKKEIESARASSPPQAATHARTQTPSMNGHLDAADIGRRRNKVINHYQGVLLENGPEDAREWLEENHPDLVDTIIGHAKGSA